MKLRDIQVFIPGWNIVYAIREYCAFNRRVAQQQQALVDLQVQGQKDLKLVQSYADQRNAAKARGNFDVASEFDKKIAELVLSYTDKIK